MLINEKSHGFTLPEWCEIANRMAVTFCARYKVSRHCRALDAEDYAQEVLPRFWGRLTGKGHPNPSLLLQTMLRNRIVDDMRLKSFPRTDVATHDDRRLNRMHELPQDEIDVSFVLDKIAASLTGKSRFLFNFFTKNHFHMTCPEDRHIAATVFRENFNAVKKRTQRLMEKLVVLRGQP